MELKKFYNTDMSTIHYLSTETMDCWKRLISAIDDSNISVKALNLNISEKYIGDFYGLLQNNNISIKYWYPMLIVNGYNSPNEYDGNRSLKIIKERFLKLSFNLIKSSHR
jgi:hypothetical protein